MTLQISQMKTADALKRLADLYLYSNLYTILRNDLDYHT